MLYLGIDQHARQLTVNARDEAGQVLWRRQVSTHWQKVNQFCRDFQVLSQEHGGYLAIVEVCGFNDWLLELLPDYGCQEVILVQPEERARHKTDRRDANRLSELLWVNRQRLLAGQPVKGLRRVAIATAEQRDDRRLTARRRDVGAELTRVINAVQHLLRRHNLPQECPTKGIQTRAARRWLEQLPLRPLERLELDQLLATWQLLEGQREALDARITERVAGQEQAKLVLTLPGAGAYSALGIACRIGPIERFSRPRSLANYFGLTPSSCNSGEASGRLGSITKQGSAMVRFLLGQLVLHALRKDKALRQWYKRIRTRRGSKIARVAVMRRLACCLWHMLSKRQPYRYGELAQAQAGAGQAALTGS